MQLSMLVLWLLELMLRKLGSLKDAGLQADSPQYQSSWDALNRFTEQRRIMVRQKEKQLFFSPMSHFNFNDAYLPPTQLGMYTIKSRSRLQFVVQPRIARRVASLGRQIERQPTHYGATLARSQLQRGPQRVARLFRL